MVEITASKLNINGQSFDYYAPESLTFAGISDTHTLSTLPFSIKILLENAMRHAHTAFIDEKDLVALATWQGASDHEVQFVPSRVVLQDFTGVPAVVDLAAMRDAMVTLGGDPQKINPISNVDLVIDHSVMVDKYGFEGALDANTELEFERNKERYQFLRWGQSAFQGLKVVPPGTGIVHQVNLEYLADVVANKNQTLYPDTLVGTDSHTTMINGLGILGWGVGGIEAEAAMLGQPIPMLIPNVVGFEFTGKMVEGVTATDLVLRVTQDLRAHGVVGQFVEFFGDGLKNLTLADRATISNMAPEYGATCGLFPIDSETLNYLRLTNRAEAQIKLVEQYAKAIGLWYDQTSPKPRYPDTLTLDLGQVVPAIAGPKRPQDRISLSESKQAFQSHLDFLGKGAAVVPPVSQWNKANINHGAIVIAAITSCTNTSNPAVMLAAGLIAQKASAKGLTSKDWVKTSLAPGSKVVVDYLERAGLTTSLQNLGFHVVGFGCTTCIGNSGPLAEGISKQIKDKDLIVSGVLSGNRNFEGRIHADSATNYLASPPLVVAYALAGTMQIDFQKDPIGQDKNGADVFLKDIWPSQAEIQQALMTSVTQEQFKERYNAVYEGTENWRAIELNKQANYEWPESTYIRKPVFFDGMPKEPTAATPIKNARCLALLGDSITTDHISPAGSIGKDTPAARYLREKGVEEKQFNSYGSRRGNHEVMMRGTFANVRIQNQLTPEKTGGWTRCFINNDIMSIFDAAQEYKKQNTSLVVVAGKEYGTGSSRDWAAKGTLLLGVKAVIAQSYERIHRSNLIGMGVLPLEFQETESAQSFDIKGDEHWDIPAAHQPGEILQATGTRDNGEAITVKLKSRIDTPQEMLYFNHGGILQYVLRQLAKDV